MSEISNNIILVILVTSFATYLSRFLGVVSSEKIKETSKIFNSLIKRIINKVLIKVKFFWFVNCDI